MSAVATHKRQSFTEKQLGRLHRHEVAGIDLPIGPVLELLGNRLNRIRRTQRVLRAADDQGRGADAGRGCHAGRSRARAAGLNCEGEPRVPAGVRCMV